MLSRMTQEERGTGRREETRPRGTLILDFQLLELRGNKCLLVKPPRMWHFVLQPKQLRERGTGNPEVLDVVEGVGMRCPPWASVRSVKYEVRLSAAGRVEVGGGGGGGREEKK